NYEQEERRGASAGRVVEPEPVEQRALKLGPVAHHPAVPVEVPGVEQKPGVAEPRDARGHGPAGERLIAERRAPGALRYSARRNGPHWVDAYPAVVVEPDLGPRVRVGLT